MSAKKVNKVNILKEVAVYTAILFILSLTAFNINKSLKRKEPVVLAAETKIDSQSEFWNSFLRDNPSYLPGLIENGDLETAKKLDPNYLLSQF